MTEKELNELQKLLVKAGVKAGVKDGETIVLEP